MLCYKVQSVQRQTIYKLEIILLMIFLCLYKAYKTNYKIMSRKLQLQRHIVNENSYNIVTNYEENEYNLFMIWMYSFG